MINEIKNKIHTLVQKYEQGKEIYRTSRFNETQVRNEFLDPLFEIFGWDIRNIAGKNTNEREVLLEEPLKANAASHTKKPDYTFRLFGERKFFLEAKKPCVHIEREDNPAKQVRCYGFTAGLKISVLSNFEHLYIYDTSYPVEQNDTRSRQLSVNTSTPITKMPQRNFWRFLVRILCIQVTLMRSGVRSRQTSITNRLMNSFYSRLTIGV